LRCVVAPLREKSVVWCARSCTIAGREDRKWRQTLPILHRC
jgi:hypothetical protein